MAKKLTIDEHNKAVFEKIAKLQSEIDELNLTFKSEAEKPQATLAECNAFGNRKK